MISALGALIGILIGIAICFIQQNFGVVSLGDSNSFAVSSYPVRLDTNDIILVFATVIIVGVISVGIPIRSLTNRILRKSEIKK